MMRTSSYSKTFNKSGWFAWMWFVPQEAGLVPCQATVQRLLSCPPDINSAAQKVRGLGQVAIQ